MTLGRDLPILIPGSHPLPDDITPGDPALCGCDDRSLCVSCGEPVCPNHGGAKECADAGWHHDDPECADRCMWCAAEARDDRQHDLADEMREERHR